MYIIPLFFKFFVCRGMSPRAPVPVSIRALLVRALLVVLTVFLIAPAAVASVAVFYLLTLLLYPTLVSARWQHYDNVCTQTTDRDNYWYIFFKEQFSPHLLLHVLCTMKNGL